MPPPEGAVVPPPHTRFVKERAMQFVPALADMQQMTSQGNLCPLYAEISADLETPVSAYPQNPAQGPWSFCWNR
jgi:hypothetical protein